MAANSRIEWTHHTFNLWEGCIKVSPSCDNCYAEARDTWIHQGAHWGPNSRRFFHTDAYWDQLSKWNAAAERKGERHRVFVGSLMDICEILPRDHPDYRAMEEARERFWPLVTECSSLVFLLLTKRPKYYLRLVPKDWREGFPANAIPGATIENNEWLRKRIGYLTQVPAAVRFLSCEPLFEVLEDGDWADAIDWYIGGGESGPKARPTHPANYLTLRDTAHRHGKDYHFKQWGNWLPCSQAASDEHRVRIGQLMEFPIADQIHAWPDGTHSVWFKDKHLTGRLLDSRTWDELPGALA